MFNWEDCVKQAKNFAQADENTRFGWMINHRVDTSLCETIFAPSRQYHVLPNAQEQATALNTRHRR